MSDTERPLERARGAPLELADTRRIQALVDGVFAIVMTLLVLTIKVPTVVGPVSDAVLRRTLVDMLPGLGIYGITFLLLGLMWYSNRSSFSVIARGDAALRGLTIVWLMLVAMLPFLFFGGEAIYGFAVAMCFGIVIGAYSSIFVASPMQLILGVRRDAFSVSGEASKAAKERAGAAARA